MNTITSEDWSTPVPARIFIFISKVTAQIAPTAGEPRLTLYRFFGKSFILIEWQGVGVFLLRPFLSSRSWLGHACDYYGTTPGTVGFSQRLSQSELFGVLGLSPCSLCVCVCVCCRRKCGFFHGEDLSVLSLLTSCGVDELSDVPEHLVIFALVLRWVGFLLGRRGGGWGGGYWSVCILVMDRFEAHRSNWLCIYIYTFTSKLV